MTEITLQLDDTPIVTLSAHTEKSLFDTLTDADILLRKACINGACGVCRCRLVSGTIDYRGRHPYGLNDGEQAGGWILPCIAFPKTDLKLMQLKRQEPK
ncbi:2Fe-2S iron-sulfur cluster-binding protein [Nitrincola sp.]|uniref:2Fe-2S iron-sulfur cluster-binding protein n=1 Tax=Nitrincola sp. TaxID=1926584 RepID=UPI003A92595C